MKLRLFSFACLSALLLSAAPAFAQGKFAYVDMQRALDQIEEGKAIKADLKAEFDQKQTELDKEQEALRSEYASAEALAREGVLSPDKVREKQAELEQKVRKVTQFWQDSQKALSEKERQATQSLFLKMSSVVQTIAEAEGFTFVFERATLVYAPPALDITNELVRKYNAKYPAKPASKPVAKPEGDKAKK